MSHEIRSPMNAILGFIRIIKDEEKLSENGKQYIELISNSGAQLVSVIEDILDTSKIQANQLRLSIREFEVNDLLNDLFSIHSAQVRDKYKLNTIMLPPVLSHPSPFMLYSDDLRIKQILNNLLSNAIKFTPKGIIEFGYSLIVDDINPLVQFYVKDTGIGLAKEALALIFERFRQADDSYTRMYGGSGLGLAISKGLTELLGGKIWVESEEGKGSTFYFTIPIKTANVDGNQIAKSEPNVNQIKYLNGLNWSGKTIFIVEDLHDIRFFLQKVLAKTGAKTVFATSLREAREQFSKTSNIDLILLDIRLPDGDGYDLAVEFKAKKPNIPIIAQTAYAMQGEKEKSVRFGCDDFITKPLNQDLLFMKIDMLLKRKY
jgi:CheY-like chemotaxis protein